MKNKNAFSNVHNIYFILLSRARVHKNHEPNNIIRNHSWQCYRASLSLISDNIIRHVTLRYLEKENYLFYRFVTFVTSRS